MFSLKKTNQNINFVNGSITFLNNEYTFNEIIWEFSYLQYNTVYNSNETTITFQFNLNSNTDIKLFQLKLMKTNENVEPTLNAVTCKMMQLNNISFNPYSNGKIMIIQNYRYTYHLTNTYYKQTNQILVIPITLNKTNNYIRKFIIDITNPYDHSITIIIKNAQTTVSNLSNNGLRITFNGSSFQEENAHLFSIQIIKNNSYGEIPLDSCVVTINELIISNELFHIINDNYTPSFIYDSDVYLEETLFSTDTKI
jgi:hypothetical protein